MISLERKGAIKLIVLFWAAGLTSNPVWSAGKTTFLTHIEYWWANNAFENDEKEVETLVAAGVDSGSIDIQDGMGFRVGWFFPTRNPGVEFGFSFGYVKGPTATIALKDTAPTREIDADLKTDFFRLLLEMRNRFRFQSGNEFRFRTGLGAAQGNIKLDGSFRGPSNGFLEDKDNWLGVTWEFAPSIAFVGKKSTFELGLAIAGFPTLKQNDGFNEFEWMPFGLRVGLEF